jgi:hypothetical protein
MGTCPGCGYWPIWNAGTSSTRSPSRIPRTASAAAPSPARIRTAQTASPARTVRTAQAVGHACGRPARGDPAARTPGKRKPGPAGATVPQDPADPALTPAGPSPPGQYGTWRLTLAGRDLDLDFETLTGPCDHRHESTGHDPGKLLKHLTAILNQECTFRTCRTPERTSDYEHAIPWPQGRTCTCNAHPCCRRNHQNKQADGWHVQGTGQPGYFTWTLPSGRTYLSRPTSYPT